MKIAIVGAGVSGLTAAYRLSQKGHQVTVFEKEKYAGGLSAGFKKKNWAWSVEFFFHHLFTSDTVAKNLISELGLADKFFFPKPITSIYLGRQISQFDSLFSVIKFPHLTLLEKIRTGAVTAYLKSTKDWQQFEKITAYSWLKKYYGQKTFQILWQPLLISKFGDKASTISMTWFWGRIKKRSQRLGYLRGGFQLLIDKLVEKIKENQGKIIFSYEVKNLKDLTSDFDKIIITVPTEKLFATKLPPMLGAINLILVLGESFLTDGTYWLNINEPGFPFVAVVEHTNFVDKKYYGGNHLLYVGGYYLQNHRYFKMSKEQIFKEFLPYLKKINPRFNQLSVISYQLSANLFAQPVVPINYSKIIPSFKTPLKNVYLANMQMVYPWDRGINYAIEIGERIANEILKN